jgi:predicted nuclease of predicted toxin-antitoxin system
VNLLADESIDRQIVELLRENGHSVIYIAELAPSISDDDVFDRANAAASILLTADKDFGELVFRDNRLISDGVVLIRLAGLSSTKKAAMVLDVISKYAYRLNGRFSVVSPGKLRTRTRN